MCVYLYIHNKYTQYKHIYYVNTNFYFDSPNSIIHSFIQNKLNKILRVVFLSSPTVLSNKSEKA